MDLLARFWALVARADRRMSAQQLAQDMGADDLIVFLPDPEVGVLLPAPGFPQTVPRGGLMRALVNTAAENGEHHAEVLSPFTGLLGPAVARQAEDGSVLVLLGGSPNADRLRMACQYLPLAACALRRERQELEAQQHAQTAQRIAEQARTLAHGLEAARRELQVALHEAEEMRRRSAFLAEASSILASSLEYETTLEGVARLSVPFVADWCFVDLVDEDDGLRRVGVACGDHGEQEREQQLDSATRGLIHPAAAAMQPLALPHPELITRLGIAERLWLAGAPEHLDTVERIGIRSFLRVCLKARGRALGVITFASATSGRTFDVRDIDLAIEVASRAALAVDNARLYREAQTALRLRTDFLSMAAHELRTPLTPIQLQLESLARQLARLPTDDGATTARLRDKLTVAIGQTKRLGSLIENLLDVSRISAGRLDLHLEEVDLAAVVDDVAGRLSMDLHSAGCTLEVRTPGAVVGRWDRFRLEQVVTNHLSNAIKYGAGKRIEIEVHADHSTATMRIRDHGIGIPPEKQPRIFDKFERAVSGLSYGGFGLGLWIVRQIVDALEGSVSVISQPGHGATFIIQLPRRNATMREIAPTRSKALPSA